MSDDRADWPSFDDFFRKAYPDVMRLAMYAGATWHQAEEAANQTMFEVLRRWDEIRNPGAWAKRAVLSTFVKAKQRDAQHVNRMIAGGVATPESHDAGLNVWEDEQWVKLQLSQLPAAQRETMALVCEGFSPTDIAGLLGKRPEAVRQNLRLARRALRDRLNLPRGGGRGDR